MEAAMTERTSTRMMANSIAVPFSLFRFMAISLFLLLWQQVVVQNQRHGLNAVRLVCPPKQVGVEYVAGRNVRQRLALFLLCVGLRIYVLRRLDHRTRHAGHLHLFNLCLLQTCQRRSVL